VKQQEFLDLQILKPIWCCQFSTV